LWFRVGGQEINGGPGTFVSVPGVLHSFANRMDEPANFAFLTELSHLALTLPSWPPDEIIRLGERYDTVEVL
jgi:hypothetical protein